MKFLVDAQLPRRLALRLRERGHDAVQTLELPRGNKTSDAEINDLSIREQRVVVTKDSDFVDSRLLQGKPWKLLLVSTGNIRNQDLEELFLANLEAIVSGLSSFDYVELSRSSVVCHA